MRRILILATLVTIAGVAGIVRSHSRVQATIAELPGVFHDNSSGEAREEIRKDYVLSTGANVEVAGINGPVTIETSDTTKAEVYIERIGSCSEALGRRKITIEADANSLRIRGAKGDAGFFASLFGSNPRERVTLKLPRQISLNANGVNGAVSVGEVDGAVEVHGVNGRVQISGATGSAEFRGVNGNILVGLKQTRNDGVTISGVNGNIELQLREGLNADFDAHGMNGRVISDLSDVVIDKEKHGSYSARIGSGGNAISVHGINGNIRLTRTVAAAATSAETGKDQAGSN